MDSHTKVSFAVPLLRYDKVSFFKKIFHLPLLMNFNHKNITHAGKIGANDSREKLQLKTFFSPSINLSVVLSAFLHTCNVE